MACAPPSFGAVGGRAPHRVGGVLQLLHRVAQLPPLLLVARQLLELPRRLFGLVGERALRRAGVRPTALARLRHAALPLHLLLLPPRQLLQLLDQLIDLLIAALLLGALLHLVLVRQLVELELEQIREVVGELVLLPAAAAPAALLLRDLQLVLLLGVLQQLQRALLGRQRGVGLHRLQVGLGRLHLVGRLGQRLGDLVVGRIDGAEPRLQLADQLFDLLAQLRLREVQEHDVLAELFRLGLRLVADDVERRGDDLALLLRQLADLLAAAAAAATAARLRLRRLVVLLERPDLHEVDVAGRGLRSLDRVGVGRLRVVGDEVAGFKPSSSR